MLGKSINWISLVFLLAIALLYNDQKVAHSQEEQNVNPTRSLQNSNFKEYTFSSPISQVTPPTLEAPTQPNLRRKPIGEEEEFKPEAVPLILPTPEELEGEQAEASFYKASPNVSIITPSGYGADWGSIGVGIGFQSRTRFTESSDAVFGLGFGLGDSQNLVGIQVSLISTDVSDPFQDGSIGFKVHRRLPEDFSIAVGVQGGATFGVTDGGSSVYGVISKRFLLKEDVREPFSEIYTSIGIGGGQFRSESDINDGVESVGVFGSVAVRVFEPMSLITEWSGQDLTIGVSIVPFKDFPFVIVPAITDVTGSAGDGVRFIFGAGYSFSF
jgi:hypothetical protein